MPTTKSNLDLNTRKKLEALAKMDDFKLSDLIRIYSSHFGNRDLDEITENGMKIIEEVEILAMHEEGGDGRVYSSVEEYLASLENISLNDKSRRTQNI